MKIKIVKGITILKSIYYINWQIVIFPTLTIMRIKHKNLINDVDYTNYVSISVNWLIFYVNLIIGKSDFE